MAFVIGNNSCYITQAKLTPHNIDVVKKGEHFYSPLIPVVGTNAQPGVRVAYLGYYYDINNVKVKINNAYYYACKNLEKIPTCQCQCNYACTCNCNYAIECTCQCNYACTCQCNYACTCNCNYACTCQCNYCTCQCNYSCTCQCAY